VVVAIKSSKTKSFPTVVLVDENAEASVLDLRSLAYRIALLKH